MGRQIQISLLATGLLAVSMVLVWMLTFRPVVYEITVYMDSEPTPRGEVPVSNQEPVSPRERAMFDRAYSLSDESY